MSKVVYENRNFLAEISNFKSIFLYSWFFALTPQERIYLMSLKMYQILGLMKLEQIIS